MDIGICVARRDLYDGDALVGDIALFYDPAIGGYRLIVTRSGAVQWDEAYPERADAIRHFNSQLDLAWRTLLAPTHHDSDTPALPADETEIMRAITHALAGPAPSIGEELFG